MNEQTIANVDKHFDVLDGKLVSRLVAYGSLDTQDGIVWYVDIEHDDAVFDPKKREGFDAVRYDRGMMCSRASGLPCEAIHYHDATSENVLVKNVRAICISGNTTDWIHYDFKTFQPLFSIIKSGEVPVLAFCGGHQLIALAYDGKCDAIRNLNPGEPEVAEWAPGHFAEVGFTPLTIVKDDPLFEGLGKQPIFFESHYWEVKELPDEFEVLASTVQVRVQVLKHKAAPVYGTQFHPEVNNEEHPDGLRLLQNFFRIAGIER